MFPKDYLAEVLEYIEHNINEPFNIHEIPVNRYLSTMQLYRDFYNLTGHSVKEYIRKRRLSNALAMVKHSEKGLAEIAYDYGYSSQQAFCKCVKAATGLTPVEYGSSGGYYYYPKFCFQNKHQIYVTSESIPKTIHMKYYHSQIRGIENRSLAYLFSLIPDYNGRIFGRNGKQLNNKFCYELNIEYKDDAVNLLNSSDFQEISPVTSHTDMFARISVKNIEKDINGAWDYLYTEWLKASMFEQSDQPYFEEYIHTGNGIKRLVLYLPVIKRSDYDKIRIVDCEAMYFLVSRSSGADAERKASETVLKYLSRHNPFYINKTDSFYVASNNNVYTCGVMIDKKFVLHNDSSVERLQIEGGRYAVLEGNCCGDSIIYEKMLNAWISDNGFERDKGACFTVYETKGSYKPKDIKAAVFIKLRSL